MPSNDTNPGASSAVNLRASSKLATSGPSSVTESERQGEPERQGESQRRRTVVPPVPRKLGSSIAKHPGRAKLAAARTVARVEKLARLKAQGARTRSARESIEALVEDEIDFSDPDWVQGEVERRLIELGHYAHPKTMDYIEQFRPALASQRPPDANALIEAMVMRELPWMVELRAQLGSRTDNLGAPSARCLVIALFECLALTDRPKAIKPSYLGFMGKDELLDAAFDHPVGCGRHARAYNSITTSLSRQLDHHDPELLVALNGDLLRQRRAALGPDYGRRVVIDGMKWEAHTLQQAGYNDIEEQLLKRGFSRATFGYHGPGAGWRGFTLLVLRDLHSRDILGWLLAPANEREHGFVEALFLRVLEYFPEWRPEVLIADREYDVAQLYSNLLARFGVHLICPLRDLLDPAYAHAATEGVPECSAHGFMKRVRDREFPHQDVRERLGLQPGQAAPIDRARVEWACPECGARATTYFKRNPRLYGYFPRRGDHKLAGQREALQILRNLAESTNASLQHRHFGLKGQLRAKWVSSDAQAEWLAGAGLFAMNLRELIHGAGGPYEQALADAQVSGLLKPQRSTPGALRVLAGGKAAAATASSGGPSASGVPSARAAA